MFVIATIVMNTKGIKGTLMLTYRSRISGVGRKCNTADILHILCQRIAKLNII